MSPPNLIVIVSDTFRPDHLGVNGHPRCKTPELDAWVARGVTFENARVSSFPTIPMRTDWFTGRFSHLRHGWRPLDPQLPSLPALLGRAGYTTQLLADTTHLLRNDFWKPFQHFHFLRGQEGDMPLCRLNQPLAPVPTDRRKTRVEGRDLRGEGPTLSDRYVHANHWRLYEAQSHIAQLCDVACRWLEDNWRASPFCLWLDCFDVHEPWCPPEYLWRMYQPDYDGEPMLHPNYWRADCYEPAELENLKARYLGLCTLVSKHLGRVLRVIEDTGLLQTSLVVFMSDHGMYLGERGRTGKTIIRPGHVDCWPFNAEISRICWTMHCPPALEIDNLRRLPHVVQAPDLLPTVLELFGLPVPETVEGSSLAKLLRGETYREPREVNLTCSTTTITAAGGEQVFCRRPAVTDGDWTLLLGEPPDPQPAELYHTAVDRAERENVLERHPDEARRLHKAMLGWLKQHAAAPEAIDRLSARNCGL